MSPAPSLSVFAHPYRRIRPFVGDERSLSAEFAGRPGVSLVWCVQDGGVDEEMVRHRPGGVSLIVILPRAESLAGQPDALGIIERCRPQSILPYHDEPDPAELRQLARRPPDDLPAEVTDYLTWRGFGLDHETSHLIRRTLEMSADVRTVAALARGLYQSRRALGRRFLNSGLPVPSHWLHFGRVLRSAIRLQASDDSLFTVACELGYPDGFALSNQMKRLLGVRPTLARDHLGWEWILEAWLQQEAREGNLTRGDAAIAPTPTRSGDAARSNARDGADPPRTTHKGLARGEESAATSGYDPIH